MSELNECPRLIEVHQLWEGEIGARRAGEVRQHLAHCSFCRAEYESWRRLSGLLARGDPAQPLAPARQRRLKEQLLEVCASALDPAQSAHEHLHGGLPRVETPMRTGTKLPPGDSAPQAPKAAFVPYRPGFQPRARLALALAPLAVAVILLLYAGRTVPPGKHWLPEATTRPQATLPRPKYEAPPRSPQIAAVGKSTRLPRIAGVTRWRGFGARPNIRPARHDVQIGPPYRIARAPASPEQPLRPSPRPSRRAMNRPRLPVSPRRSIHAFRLAAVPPEPRQESAFRLPLASTPAKERIASLPGHGPTAPSPIKRIVIQVDEPPRVEASLVTHITIIAAGNLQAPGAKLTVVRSQSEEALP